MSDDVRNRSWGSPQPRRRHRRWTVRASRVADVTTRAGAGIVSQRPAWAAIAVRLARLDELSLRHMSRARRGWLTRLFVPYTIAGTVGLPWLAAGVVVGHPLVVALALAVAGVASGMLKHYWRRRRPDVIPLLVRDERTTSFPSAHAATGAAAACALIAVAPQFAPVWIGMAALMAASRVYVGVHWPTDVAAGLGLGVLLVAVPLLAESAI